MDGLAFDDEGAVAVLAERFNKFTTKATHGKDELTADSKQGDEELPMLIGFAAPSEPKIVPNGKMMHIFYPDTISKLIANRAHNHWSPGTAVITQDGRNGTVVRFDATTELYSVKLRGGKERPFQRSQLRRAPMAKEASRKFVAGIQAYEEQNGMATYITKHLKIVRVPKEQLPKTFRAALLGKDLFWMF